MVKIIGNKQRLKENNMLDFKNLKRAEDIVIDMLNKHESVESIIVSVGIGTFLTECSCFKQHHATESPKGIYLIGKIILNKTETVDIFVDPEMKMSDLRIINYSTDKVLIDMTQHNFQLMDLV